MPNTRWKDDFVYPDLDLAKTDLLKIELVVMKFKVNKILLIPLKTNKI